MQGKLIAAAVLLALSVGSAHAAEEVCYEEQTTQSLGCSSNYNDRSADFAGTCHSDPVTVMVPVECVPKTRWVNIPYGANSSGSQVSFMSHAQICAAAGMKAANLGGKTCASGERRPTVGERWDSINYRYGKKGDGNGGDGGDKLMLVGGYTSFGGRDDYGGGSQTPTYRQMCYDNHMGARNNTKQDAAVAVFCEEK